jgi:hypothetical protein
MKQEQRSSIFHDLNPSSGVPFFSNGNKPISVKELDRERARPESVSTEGPRNAKLENMGLAL